MSGNEIVTLTPSNIAPVASADHDIDNPTRDLRIGMGIAAAFFLGFVGWATLAPLDAAAAAGGQLIVAGQRQTVQHRDGGVIQALRVKEGQKVEKGQVLIELNGAEVQAEERALAVQLINLQAERARLIAEQSGASAISWPAEFLDPANPNGELIRSAIAVQMKKFAAGRSLLGAQNDVLGQQIRQAQESASGFDSLSASQAEQARLIDEELKALRTVADKGFVATNRLRALERAKADLEGRRSGYTANSAQARAEASANQLKRLEAARAYQDKASGDLRQVEATLSELEPKYRAAHDRAERLLIRSPASGTVVGLRVFTVGGVIAAGQPLMDVVPDQAELVIAARFSPDDADDLTVGQAAQIRFPGLREAGLPLLQGELTRVSADILVDEKSNTAYYTGELKVPQSELDKIRDSRGNNFDLKPGMPVEVVVPLRKRTALQYAFEPLMEIMRRSFREH